MKTLLHTMRAARRGYAVHRWRVFLHYQRNRTFDSQTADKLDYSSFDDYEARQDTVRS